MIFGSNYPWSMTLAIYTNLKMQKITQDLLFKLMFDSLPLLRVKSSKSTRLERNKVGSE